MGREHELRLSLPVEPVYVQADPTRLVQIISNLLNNAAKYTERGGRIEISIERADSMALVRVSDNGIGIRPAMLARVFEPFAQADRASDRAQGGLGIGLSVVERLVKLHGGSVEARSEGPGRGSEFLVRLPLAAAPTAQAGGGLAASEATSAATALRIVIIEDNPDIRETLREVLELCGHEVWLAEDGAIGLELLRARLPDVALIDIGLPGMDGYAVVVALRQLQLDSTPRLIAMTGYGLAEDRRRALEAGFDAHLVKPVDPETLTQLLLRSTA